MVAFLVSAGGNNCGNCAGDAPYPATGFDSSPLFRTRRDAELTRRIYERHPVLVNHSKEGERRVWPVRYRQGLFHSLNHSTGIHPPSAAFP